MVLNSRGYQISAIRYQEAKRRGIVASDHKSPPPQLHPGRKERALQIKGGAPSSTFGGGLTTRNPRAQVQHRCLGHPSRGEKLNPRAQVQHRCLGHPTEGFITQKACDGKPCLASRTPFGMTEHGDAGRVGFDVCLGPSATRPDSPRDGAEEEVGPLRSG